jgi:hypothetical protein
MIAHRADLKRAGGQDRSSSAICESLTCAIGRERSAGVADSLVVPGQSSMLTAKQRRTTIRTLRGWAIAVLTEAGAIRECEHHGWMQDRADPHARARAFRIARVDPPPGTSADEACAAIEDILGGIGDTCPECEAGPD